MTATFFFANYDAGPCKRDGSIYVYWVHFREHRLRWVIFLEEEWVTSGNRQGVRRIMKIRSFQTVAQLPSLFSLSIP